MTGQIGRTRRPIVVAHRSLTPGAVANVRSSVPLAAATGADLIELDVRLSLDRVPMVFHDAMLGNATGARGWVRLWPSALLSRLRVRGGEPEDTIPTLAGLLRSFPDGSGPALHLKDRQALPATLRALHDLGFEGRAWLWLEHLADVVAALRTMPGMRCVLLRPSAWRDRALDRYVADAARSGAAGISLPWGVIDAALVNKAHRHGLLTFSRMEDPARLAGNIAAGLDGIITTDPAGTVSQLSHLAGEGADSRTLSGMTAN